MSVNPLAGLAKLNARFPSVDPAFISTYPMPGKIDPPAPLNRRAE
jgi:hypothetical protein